MPKDFKAHLKNHSAQLTVYAYVRRNFLLLITSQILCCTALISLVANIVPLAIITAIATALALVSILIQYFFWNAQDVSLNQYEDDLTDSFGSVVYFSWFAPAYAIFISAAREQTGLSDVVWYSAAAFMGIIVIIEIILFKPLLALMIKDEYINESQSSDDDTR